MQDQNILSRSQNSKMPATPTWNDTEAGRSAWRAAHARKTRSKATRAGGRRIGGKRKVTRVSRERSESYVPNSLQGVFGADVAQVQDITPTEVADTAETTTSRVDSREHHDRRAPRRSERNAQASRGRRHNIQQPRHGV